MANASYTNSNNILEIGKIVMTRKYCPNSMENRFLKEFKKINTLHFENGLIKLKSNDKKIIIKFQENISTKG